MESASKKFVLTKKNSWYKCWYIFFGNWLVQMLVQFLWKLVGTNVGTIVLETGCTKTWLVQKPGWHNKLAGTKSFGRRNAETHFGRRTQDADAGRMSEMNFDAGRRTQTHDACPKCIRTVDVDFMASCIPCR